MDIHIADMAIWISPKSWWMSKSVDPHHVEGVQSTKASYEDIHGVALVEMISNDDEILLDLPIWFCTFANYKYSFYTLRCTNWESNAIIDSITAQCLKCSANIIIFNLEVQHEQILKQTVW